MIIIINVSLAANQPIRMISEGSCDTEDWSNDAENTHVTILHNITGFTVLLTSVNFFFFLLTSARFLNTSVYDL